MTSNDRQDVRKSAKENDYRVSSTERNVMVNSNGDRLKEVGTNRTIYKGNTYFGSKSIRDALNN